MIFLRLTFLGALPLEAAGPGACQLWWLRSVCCYVWRCLILQVHSISSSQRSARCSSQAWAGIRAKISVGAAAMLACTAPDVMETPSMADRRLRAWPGALSGSAARLCRRPGQPAAGATVGRGLRPGLCRAPHGAAGNRYSGKQAWNCGHRMPHTLSGPLCVRAVDKEILKRQSAARFVHGPGGFVQRVMRCK